MQRHSVSLLVATLLVSFGCWEANEADLGLPVEAGGKADGTPGVEPNLAMRGEIAAAISDGRVDSLETQWIVGAAGQTPGPEEAWLAERLVERIGRGVLTAPVSSRLMIGAVVSQAIVGTSQSYLAEAFDPGASTAPVVGAVVTAASIEQMLVSHGVDGLRGDVVAYLFHVRDVAAHNDAVLRAQPKGWHAPVKGHYFVPVADTCTWFTTPCDPVTSAKVLTATAGQLEFAIDFSYPLWVDPRGLGLAGFVSGGSGIVDIEYLELGTRVWASEIAEFVNVAGLRHVGGFDDVSSLTVPSPPASVWAEVINPGALAGQKARILSSLLDLVEAHGTVQWNTLHTENRDNRWPSSITAVDIDRASVVASLSDIVKLFPKHLPLDPIGTLVVQPDGLEVARISLQALVDARTQTAGFYHRPRNWLSADGEQVYVHGGIPVGLVSSGTAWPFEEPLHAWYLDEARDVGQGDDPLYEASWLPPRYVDISFPPVSFQVDYGGYHYTVWKSLVWRDGELVSPVGFEVFDTYEYLFEDRIYFFYDMAWIRWATAEEIAQHPITSRGTLVFDLAAERWYRTSVVNLRGIENLEVDDGRITGTLGWGETAQPFELDVRTLVLEAAQ